MKSLQNYLEKILLTLGIAWVLYGACGEFYQIAWGSGAWRGEFSRTWFVLYYGFIVFCVALFALLAFFIWKREKFENFIERMIAFRERLGVFRWVLWLIVFIFPVWFFQYTAWGLVFQKFYLRIAIWALVIFLLAFLASRKRDFTGWKEFLSALVLTASAFSIAAALKEVSGYPFSLGWSEGNRLWDYSAMFGRGRYIYPEDQYIPVLLDFSRQLVGGWPFIFPNLNITAERTWVGLTLVVPYLLLGIAAFRMFAKDKKLWLLTTLWTFLFLKQGPIHPPLVLSAALVALAWGSRLWLAIPLIIGAGYFAQAGRFTWAFAPAIWIVMLEFASASFTDAKAASTTWTRSIALGIFGLVGGFMLTWVAPSLTSLLPTPEPIVEQIPATVAPAQVIVPTATAEPVPQATAIPQVSATPVPTEAPSSSYLEFIQQQIESQPYLWYRLLPNSTYGMGILLALLLAAGPILTILFYLPTKNIWQLTVLQKLSLVLPLLAFFVVGIVASTKIGGGGDLHNMDMFLIGLLFTGIIAWQKGGGEWLQDAQLIPSLMKAVIVIMLVSSSVTPLMEMRSYSFGNDVSWLATLTDTPEAALEMLPPKDVTDSALAKIQEEVDKARAQGEVLFMDQRQLLTFGYITDVPLVPEYEKKWLMNEALGDNAEYFQPFYRDIAAHRFTLIVSEPLHTPQQDSSFQFGEENNAWVKWVSAPVLCYYEPLTTIKTVRVQLLVPKQDVGDCSAVMPK